MHRLVIPLLALIAGLIFGITSDSHSSVARTWTAVHSGATGGEGSGIGLAKSDQVYTFPNANGPQACWADAFTATCYSWNNQIGCFKTPNFGYTCGGAAVAGACDNGTVTNSEGRCVRKEHCATCGTVQKADPVVINTGETIESEIDWTSGGVDPLVLTRNYGAFASTVYAPNYSRLGPRWRTNFDGGATYVFTSGQQAPNAALAGDKIHIVLPSGNEYSFVLSSAGVWQLVLPDIAQNTYNGVFWDYFRTDLDVSLATTAISADMRDVDGRHYVFDIKGQLGTIIFPDGYTQSLTYVGGINTSVVDSLGRKLVFKYDTSLDRPNFLSAVLTPDGQEIDYAYTNRADPALAGIVLLPSGWALASVTYPDSTPANSADNPKRIYGYQTSLEFPFLLANITDERGVVNSNWTYDSVGRALTNEKSNGQEHFDFAYDDVNNKVTVTNPLGRKTVYTLQTKWGAVNNIVAVDGVATTNCAASNTVYAYDANGFRNQATDAEGRVTQWTRNARGLPTTTVEGVGTASAKTTTTTWDTTRPLPTQIAMAGLTTNMTYNPAGQMTQLSQVDTTTTTVPYSTNGQTRTTAFNYTPFTSPAPPAVGPTGAAVANVPLPSTLRCDLPSTPTSFSWACKTCWRQVWNL